MVTKKEFIDKIDSIKPYVIQGHIEFLPMQRDRHPYTCIHMKYRGLDHIDYSNFFGFSHEGSSWILSYVKKLLGIPQENYALTELLSGKYPDIVDHIAEVRLNCLDLYKEYVISEGLYEEL